MKNTNWFRWEDRNQIENSDQPAIYFIAYSKENISDTKFSMIKEIVYIGMTISNGGLKSRLNQFEKTIKGKEGHGGAVRVRSNHKDIKNFLSHAYVSATIFPISKMKNTSDDWRNKGDCVGHEYKSFAEYIDKHGSLPEFNDYKKSKKTKLVRI